MVKRADWSFLELLRDILRAQNGLECVACNEGRLQTFKLKALGACCYFGHAWMRELGTIRYRFKMIHWYHLEPLACSGAILLLASLLNLEMEKTIRIVDCIRIIKIHVNMLRVVLEDEPFAVLVGD